MSEVVLDNQGSSGSTWRRSRVGLLLSTAVVTALYCLCATAQNSTGTLSDDRLQGVNDQNGNATATDQNGNATATDQNGNATATDQNGNATATGQNGNATATGQNGNAAATGQNGNATAAGQNGNAAATGQNGNAMAMGQTLMSADQIISILLQQPDLLDSMKAMVAEQAGVDPSTISDNMLYNSIRQDANLRAQVTRDLNQLGFSPNPIPANNQTVNATGAAGAAQTGRPLTIQSAPYVEPDHPQVIRQTSPYRNLPSLRDLYAQQTPTGVMLRRFGSDAFVVGTGNANELPMDLPAGPDYVLGAGDNIVVNLWGGRSARLSLTIDRQGQIALPEAGTITLDGLTIAQAQSAIQKALSTQFQGEHAEISLGRLRTVRVYVVGDVQRPGAYDVSSLSTPLSALYAAGGPTSRGSLRILRQYRGTQQVREIDLYDFLLHGVRSNADRLLPGDTILVPPVGAQVTVEGMVHRPAIYELNGETTLNQVLDLAGGVLISASLKQIDVARIEAHERRTMLNLQLPGDADAVKKEIADFQVQGGDDVVISQILPYNQQAVYLEGHVYRPGKYPYRDGMTINDLLKSYQDIMPEPADHAELIRLQAPDYRPETISFNLPDVMIGNDSIKLQPFDLIRVYSRYEIDSPQVSIQGDVLRPGTYPMSQGMTVAALVRMAGGFKRSAYRDEADLSSYVVQDGQKVLLNHSNVAVEKALDGDKNADVALKPGDVVSIRQLAGWQDIGASVAITGEIQHVGSYGIQEGERLSSVLKRAGGFRESAYPDAAVLERVQVRQLGEQSRQQMIQRVETTPININAGAMSAPDQKDLQASMQQQRDQVLATLRSRPATGRQVIGISAAISKWENTSADIELRAGDTIVIPKRPNFVMVTGQVYNPEAITYMPGKDADWYLKKAGGVTQSGNRGVVFVVRADGSIVGHGSIWSGSSVMNLRIKPGDSIVVPEKIVGGSEIWKNVIGAAQIMSSIAITGAVTGIF